MLMFTPQEVRKLNEKLGEEGFILRQRHELVGDPSLPASVRMEAATATGVYVLYDTTTTEDPWLTFGDDPGALIQELGDAFTSAGHGPLFSA